MKNQWFYKVSTALLIVMLAVAALPVKPAFAAPVTYNFQISNGAAVATGIATNDATACGTNPTVATITLMSTAAFNCTTTQSIRPGTAGAQNILDVWFNTAYAVNTTVTGTSLKIRLREASGGGPAQNWTAGIRLVYVSAAGVITNFTGAEVTQAVNDGTDNDYTLSLAAQSATVPAGSKIGIRIRATAGNSTNMRVYFGNTASNAGGTSGVLIVNEVPAVTTYALTYNGNTNTGGTAPTDASSPYASGTTVTALGNTGTLVKTGYTFTGWNTLAAGTGTHYNTGATFLMPAAATTLYADWTGTVTYNGNTNTSGLAPTDATAYHPATTVTVLGNTGALAKTGYTFAGWNTQANGLGTNYVAGNTFPFNGNITLYARWNINTYTLTYTAGANGTVTGTSPQTVNHGANGTAVTAVPNTGYHFVSWSDGVLTASRTDTNVTGNITATANFAINTYTLTYTAGANGTVTGTSPQTVNHGANGTAVTAVPDTGYHFVSWSDGILTPARTDNNVTANITVTANFAIDTFTLTYTTGAGGTITGTSPQTVNHGANGTAVTAVPNIGYHFVDWSDGVLTASRTDIAITANLTATANFAINSLTLTYTAGANGIVTGTSPQTVNYGTDGTAVTAVPNAGYHFVDWSDGSTANPRTDTAVAANITVTANFAIDTFTLTYTAGANGSLTGTSPQTVNYGTDGTAVTPVADAGYHFVDWSDGSTANPRTDTNVTANVTVTANFALTPVSPVFTSANTITFDAGFAGSFNITTTGTLPMTIVSAGTLPSGVTFTDNGDGTATLGGTPALGSNGTYNLVFTASNSAAPNGVQPFTFIVKNGPTVGANGINSKPDTGDGKIGENESIIDTLGLTKLTVQFSQDVYDDPTDVLDYGHDATNPANYILVRSTTNSFATVDCAGGVVAPDVSIKVNSVTYDKSSFVATLSINDGFPLNVVGFYRLYVCGTTSIVDATNRGLELAGNGTTPGTDFLRNFRISTIVTTKDNNGSGASSSTLVTSGFLIPVTGFAPDKVTVLPAQPIDKAYTSMGQMMIEIPTLGVKFPIVGASIKNKTWDLTWLKDSVAYLEGSAYPTTAGNTVLTAHVQDANKNLGPFSDIKGMTVGQNIYIHVNGQVYVYQVQENSKVTSTSITSMFKHEEDSWITLVTCEDFNAKTGLYSSRRMVRAVLISVIFEK